MTLAGLKRSLFEDLKIELVGKVDKAIRRIEKVKEDVSSNPFSWKNFIIGATASFAISFGVGYTMRELLAQQVKEVVGYTEIYKGEVSHFIDFKKVSGSEGFKTIFNYPAKELIRLTTGPEPSPNMTLGEYLTKYPSYNVDFKVPEGFDMSTHGWKLIERTPIYGIVKEYPFSLFALFGASLASGFLGGITYSLKGLRKLITQ